MIDELELIKSIITELSGAGLGFGLAYVGYLLIVKIMTIGGFLWGLKYIADVVNGLLTSGITKKQADKIQLDCDKKDAEHYAEVTKLKSEVEKVKHQYKIMKEAKNESK